MRELVWSGEERQRGGRERVLTRILMADDMMEGCDPL